MSRVDESYCKNAGWDRPEVFFRLRPQAAAQAKEITEFCGWWACTLHRV